MARLVIGTDKSAVIPSIVKEVEIQQPYPLLSRVKDDNNNEIGTVCGYHTDANNQKYAVVALDAQFRLSGGQYLSSNIAVANLPNYTNGDVYGAKETATFNCDKILAQATTSGITSTAVSHCRSQTFTIAGDNYAGQFPTLMELFMAMQWRVEINAASPTGLVIPNDQNILSSSQYSSDNGWFINQFGYAFGTGKANPGFVLPILEIPIN